MIQRYSLWIRGILVIAMIAGMIGVCPPSWAASVLTSPEQNIKAANSEEIQQLFQKAFAAIESGDLPAAAVIWGQVLDQDPQNPAAWSNRGNIKMGLNQAASALADFNQAIRLAPNEPDAYLNRGAAQEALGEWSAAIADYNQVLTLNPQDAGAYNNRGNAEAGLGDWQAALADYRQAIDLNPNFALARVNYALGLYQIGKKEAAVHDLQNIVRRYPQFADARAALTAGLWANGRQGEAESNWVAVIGLDTRYKDLDWVKNNRRWPVAIATALEKFLKLQSFSG